MSIASAAGTLAALGSTPEDPGELVIAGRDGGGARVVTQVATEWRSGIQFGRLERFEFDAPDGRRLEAWIQHPAGYPADARLPVVLHVHGGPHWPLGARFGLEFRRLAEQGYRVLFLNPRGSMGYGDAYAQANVGDWGGIDARDLLAALDVACARPDVDPSRQAVTGESYGGFMTNWLIATTDRFAVAVTQSCISDFRSEYLTTDDPKGFDWDMGGSPWDQPERYERSRRWRTSSRSGRRCCSSTPSWTRTARSTRASSSTPRSSSWAARPSSSGFPARGTS